MLEVAMARKQKIHNNTLLESITKAGDRVELTFLPLESYEFDNGYATPTLNLEDLPFIINGTAQGVVVDVGHWAIDIVFDNRSDSIQMSRGQISHIQVIKPAPPPREGVFGSMTLRFESSGDFMINDDFVDPNEALAKIATGIGWTITGSEIAAKHLNSLSGELGDRIGGRIWSLSGGGFACGCAHCTLAELHEAMEWLADQLEWGGTWESIY